MRFVLGLILFSAAVVLLLATAAHACESHDGLPDPACSPGATDPRITQANIHETICVPGYSGKVRNVPQSEKNAVYAEYGITSHKPGEYEVDHIASLELAGLNDIKNLFPQPYQGQWNAHQKDKLEDHLHFLICHDKLPLADAQKMITTDWTAAYRKYFCSGEECEP